MRVLSLNELIRMTLLELCDLMVQMTHALRTYPEGSVDYKNAITNLRNICQVLTGRERSRG
jgi:hypothetical protein